ncbi:MAG: methanogenesis marker 9 domain-containing protein [Candidatus Hodarchaeota archaeon]
MKLEESRIRDIPGWEKDAPVPICMGGDYRALAFCCKPGYSLTFGFKCKRDEKLNELGLNPEEFIQIKDEFSKENNWDSDLVCFGSLSYCCMRQGGCSRRDLALLERYPTTSIEDIMKTYFQKKKELSKRILEYIKNNKGKEKIKPLLKLF